jgi:hypothetical protein
MFFLLSLFINMFLIIFMRYDMLFCIVMSGPESSQRDLT